MKYYIYILHTLYVESINGLNAIYPLVFTLINTKLPEFF